MFKYRLKIWPTFSINKFLTIKIGDRMRRCLIFDLFKKRRSKYIYNEILFIKYHKLCLLDIHFRTLFSQERQKKVISNIAGERKGSGPYLNTLPFYFAIIIFQSLSVKFKYQFIFRNFIFRSANSNDFSKFFHWERQLSCST